MNKSDELRDIVRKIGRKKEEERAAFEKLSPEEKVEKLKKRSSELLKELLQAEDENRELKKTSSINIKTVVCREKTDEVHTAVLSFWTDGTIKVRCPGNCFDCPYGEVV